MKRLCEKAGMSGYFTNHLLRATATTSLLENNVDEQLIMQYTGHSTTSGVRSYKRIGEKLKAITSDVLNGNTGMLAGDKHKESMDKHQEVESTGVSCVDTENKKVNDLGPVLNLGGATNFTINFNMAK